MFVISPSGGPAARLGPFFIPSIPSITSNMEETEALLFSGNYFDNFQYRAIFVSNHTGLSVNYLHKKAITPKWPGVMAIYTKHYETKDQDGRGRKHGQY